MNVSYDHVCGHRHHEPPQVLGLLAVGVEAGVKTSIPSYQHRAVRTAQVSPALPEGVSPTIQGKSMDYVK